MSQLVCQFASVSVFQFSDFIKTQDQLCGSRGLDKVRNFQDAYSVNSMTTVLAMGQISFCHVVIARQSDSSLTLLVSRLIISDIKSVRGFFCVCWISQISVSLVF